MPHILRRVEEPADVQPAAGAWTRLEKLLMKRRRSSSSEARPAHFWSGQVVLRRSPWVSSVRVRLMERRLADAVQEQRRIEEMERRRRLSREQREAEREALDRETPEQELSEQEASQQQPDATPGSGPRLA